jgi:hypothetical protein
MNCWTSPLRCIVRLSRPAWSASAVFVLLSAAVVPALGASAEPDATASAKRVAVPSEATRTAALKDVRSLYSEDYSHRGAPERKALAVTLLKKGTETHDDPAVSYELLSEARDIAASVADMEVAMKAVADLARQFQISPSDVAQMKVSAFKAGRMAAAAVAPADAIGLAEAALSAVEGLVEADDFASAATLAEVAMQVAEGHDNSIYDVARATLKDVQSRKVEYENMVKANTILASNPNDKAALSISGRYACLITDNWVGGLPMLLKGSDQNLANAAKAEQADPKDLPGMQKAGEAWWVAQAPLNGAVKAGALKRADLWYGRALSIATGFTKDRIQQRIKEVDTALARVSPAHMLNLLPLIDPTKDAVGQGTWSIKDGALVAQQCTDGRLQIPYQPPEEYDLIVEFSQSKAAVAMVEIVTTKKSQGVWAFIWQPPSCNLGTIKPSGQDNPCTVKLPALQPDRVYRSVLQFRRGSFRAYLDDVLVVQLSTDLDSLEMQKYWQLPSPTTLGVGCDAPLTTFSRIDIIEISGPGKRLR